MKQIVCCLVQDDGEDTGVGASVASDDVVADGAGLDSGDEDAEGVTNTRLAVLQVFSSDPRGLFLMLSEN